MAIKLFTTVRLVIGIFPRLTPFGDTLGVSAKMREFFSPVIKLATFITSILVSSMSLSQTTDSDAVIRGEYLATAGNCVSCHTSPNGDPFAGGVRFSTDFGNIYSTNITSHNDAGIGSWNLEDFTLAMREGINAEGDHLYPAFPYPSYALLNDSDISDLWAYLQTISPSEQSAKENELSFPYNQRWLMGAWKMLFLNSNIFEVDETKSEEWNRGAYLVKGLGHCGSCHTPRNQFGAEIDDKFLTGGLLTDAVGLRQRLRSWHAVDLTPSTNGLSGWSKDDIVNYLSTGVSDRGTTFGPMNEVIGNSTRHLSTSDIEAIATYLQEIPPEDLSLKAPKPEETLVGSSLYDIYCGTCHLPTGLGIEGSAPPLAGSAIVNAVNPTSLINIILYGANKPSHWTPPQHFDKVMEAFGGDLRDDEVVNIVNFIRGSWGNKAPRVIKEEVARQR